MLKNFESLRLLFCFNKVNLMKKEHNFVIYNNLLLLSHLPI